MTALISPGMNFPNKKVKLATLVEDLPNAPFSLATTLRCREGLYSIPRIASLYPRSSPYSAKQGGIKYHFLSLWNDSTRDWTPV